MLLRLTDVRVQYGGVYGTRGVSLALDEGESLALVGSNGAGKSSTLKAILGMAVYPERRDRLRGIEPQGHEAL